MYASYQREHIKKKLRDIGVVDFTCIYQQAFVSIKKMQ